MKGAALQELSDDVLYTISMVAGVFHPSAQPLPANPPYCVHRGMDSYHAPVTYFLFAIDSAEAPLELGNKIVRGRWDVTVRRLSSFATLLWKQCAQ